MKRFRRISLTATVLVVSVALAAFWSSDHVVGQAANQVLFVPTGKEFVELTPPGSATLAYVPLAAIRDGAQYAFSAPTTGFALAPVAEVSVISLNPAGTLAAGTITMPPTSFDGKVVSIFSSQVITALTLNTANGATFVPSAPTTIAAAGSSFSFVYDRPNNQWHRFQ
jgi:hypothetical protein